MNGRHGSPLERDDPELGRVRLCRGCGEEWPRDDAFWFFKDTGQVLGRCKACWSERVTVDGRLRFTSEVVELAS